MKRVLIASLVSATAALRLPGESDTTYLVRQQDLQLGLEVVIVSGHAYLKPPLLRFTELTPQQAADIPDLARLFDPVHGLPAVIPAGRNPQYEGVEAIDGVDCHKVSALYTGAQINGLLPQLSSWVSWSRGRGFAVKHESGAIVSPSSGLVIRSG